MKAALVAALVVAAALAGCTASTEEPLQDTAGPATRDPATLQGGKGAIAGLLIDDRFRPLADGLVLLQEVGRTTRSNANGEFSFVDLTPGTFTLRVTIEGHEARPQDVTVAAGEFAEANVVARRVVNIGGTIITQEYSVFIPCAVDYVANGGNQPCTLEMSEDGYQSFFTSDLVGIGNITYVITEMKANQENRFEVQIRSPADPDNGGPEVTERYAVAQFEGDYVRMVMKFGEKNVEHEAAKSYGENFVWENKYPFTTILFVDHGGREEIHGVWPENPGAPQWFTPCCGVGFSTGIKAKFVQSIFIGEPEVNIDTYRIY